MLPLREAVECLVRDHPATTVALATICPWRTMSTFTVWHSAREMTDMVHRRSDTQVPDRHATAMAHRWREEIGAAPA